MSLLDWLGVRTLSRRQKDRVVDHYELRWRPPGERGWRQVDDPDEIFDPSDIDEPIPKHHFQSHAETMGYYQGEYRLIPIDEQGRMMESVWQTWFYDGPSLEAEQREKQRKEEFMEEMHEELSKISEAIDERYQRE